MFIAVVQIFSALLGRAVVFFSFLLLPLTVVAAFRRGSLFLLLLLAGIAYQGAINVFAYHMPSYTSNMYFFHLVNLSLGMVLLSEYVLRRLRGLDNAA